MTAERLRIAVHGVVQGVGFRPFVFGLADRLGVRGFVTNRAGDVVIEAEAEAPVLREFLALLRAEAPNAARIDRVTAARCHTGDVVGDATFRIAPSAVAELDVAAIAPDVATCADCVAEIRDPSSRRFGYAFTSCSACGPRLTIVTSAPYDRERTTMASFAMCAACRAEYGDPADRRFHAQPIACPACGPQLAGEGIAGAVAALRAGKILAVKGLGGYHLVCDATRESVVAELRRRKHRDAKPFAVMVEDVAMARELAAVDDAAAALLESAARPIVLVAKRASQLAASVAPDVGDVGVMLPYTPLHHLLVHAMPGVPLVMTSGNTTDEPIAFRDDDARARLGAIADHFVTHDREIHMRCEDSVARVVDGAPMVVRRARGYAPAPLPLPFRVAVPTLALGGHLKSAFVLAVDDVAYVSPHLGDLDTPSAYDGYLQAIEHFSAMHRIAPERLVCDLHPDYATTRIAEQLATERGVPLVRVQHHRAHHASALADAGLTGPAIGVVFDGAGYGDDGTIWGGEVLVGGYADIRRAMHLAPVAQPGGDRASVEPVRMAVAYSLAAGLPVDHFADGAKLARVCERAPRTSSVGRLFDAVAALVGIERNRFEGDAAMQLEAHARRVRDAELYPFELAGEQLVVAPMIAAILRDRGADERRAVIARRFHATLVELIARACTRVARAERITDVVLSGGVFQNAILAAEVPARLAELGLTPHVHRRVPPNDGGLALGQLAIASQRGASCA